MEINAINNQQSFTGFKLATHTREAANVLFDDIIKSHTKVLGKDEYRASTIAERQKWYEEFFENIVEPLKKVSSEVIYDARKIFVKSVDGDMVEMERGKIAPLPSEHSRVVQYLTKETEGEYAHCVRVPYETAEEASRKSRSLSLPNTDFEQAVEVAKYFDKKAIEKQNHKAEIDELRQQTVKLASDLFDKLS